MQQSEIPRPTNPLDMGAILLPDGIRFRVWAPEATQVDVELHGQSLEHFPMEEVSDGLWETVVPRHGAGTRYKFRLNWGPAFPDPYSKSQPEGVHGPSEVVGKPPPLLRGRVGEGGSPVPGNWTGLDINGLVIYECHVGTATPEGTFDALVGQLGRLADLGVGAIELMPVAEYAGRWNWGYDGVYAFAVTRNYGGQAGLRRLVDAAHAQGLGVIMDVVYNHLGPDGNYLGQFSPYYFTDRYRTPWGDAINYDGPHSEWVRKYVIDNALYWLHEFHVDGLRLDATFKVHDSSKPHVLQELADTVRASLQPGRRVALIAETSENDVRYLQPATEGGYGFDAVWVDDFHHSLRCYLLGDREGYFQDYEGTLEEVARVLRHGFLFEGQPSKFLGTPRGTPAREQPARQFQYHIQTHDQVGNRAFGDRLHHQLDQERYRVASALLLLAPYTPMLFMGQEFAATSPFQFFTDHNPELGKLVTEGRRGEFRSFAAFSDPAASERIPDPQAESTFLNSKLPLDEIELSPGSEVHQLYRQLLHLRRTDPVLAAQDRRRMSVQTVAKDLLALHLHQDDAHRLLLANFGAEATIDLAHLGTVPGEASWRSLIDTDDTCFGGSGKSTRIEGNIARLPERSAALFASQ